MIREQLSSLQKITEPFALGSAHVQGPGGNTSVKSDGRLLIKASGFTFKEVMENNGVVLLDNTVVVKNLISCMQHAGNKLENTLPAVLESVPSLAKPSMEYEFHSVLGTYVLHTHSVYANVVNCTLECESILKTIFGEEEYILVPYLTPGFPIAAYLVNLKREKIPAIIFLKNHGIIVYGENSEEVLSKYNYVQEIISNHFHLQPMSELEVYYSDEKKCVIKSEKVFGGPDVKRIEKELLSQTLIPDQSIFFKDKVSSKPDSEIFLDTDNNEIVVSGTSKFMDAAKSMLQAVYFIRKSILSLGLTLDFISAHDLNILHGLASEKYRTSLLNK